MTCTLLENPPQNGQATGPKTDAGKAQSRRNSVKHGLAGDGIVLPSELADRIQIRKIQWRETYHPEGEVQEWVFERVCIESVLLDHCKHLKIAALDNVALQANESWNDDRKLDAALLFDQLKKRPETVQKRLLQTKQGCDALIADWEEIGRVLRIESAALADPMYQSRIFDLLGIPVTQRTWDRMESLVTDNPLTWIHQQIEQLKQRQADYLNDRDHRDQADTQAGIIVNAPPSLRSILRYESAIQRRLQGALNEFRTLQGISMNPADPSPSPAPQPQPQPGRDSIPRPEPRSESRPAPLPPPPKPPMRTAPNAQAAPMPSFAPRTLASCLLDRLPSRSPIVNDPERPDRKAERRRRR